MILLLFLWAFLAIGLTTAGLRYYESQKVRATRDVRVHLASVADLKVRQIQAWRRERVGDAGMFGASLSRLPVAKCLYGGGQRRDDELASWIAVAKQSYSYWDIMLAAPDGRVLFMSGYTGDAFEGASEAEDFIQKPFTSDVLGAQVREVLDTGRSGRDRS